MDDILTEIGIESCAMCIMSLKTSLKDTTIITAYLPCLRSINPCKCYYLCPHSGRKRRYNIECIRFHRQQDGLSYLKLSNPGRKRFLAECADFK